MVQINRLRVSGFKSFVDKTELDIGQGLNGIVGPNGCGKSNLVEALRWVMGENRAKSMRGGEMEDVIFAGTAARPARSIAEVTVLLDNADNTAPLPFANTPQIEVTRRIEKDKGSQYLVNGKVVRARDVQLLFADALTGAHSPALVSQGRVAQIISAKPVERRQMLEESAGVASLYTRRHEAELRLKAADENLARLDLVLNEMANRANSLREQATQALRYRELSDTIRRFESLLAWQDWGSTRDKLKKEETRFTETDQRVREALTRNTDLTQEAAEAADAVEERRREDTQARAALQVMKQTAEQMERETAHRRHEYDDLVRQIQLAGDDLTIATEQRNALRDRAAIIDADLKKIEEEEAGTPEALEALEKRFDAAQVAVRESEDGVLSLQDRIRRVQSERDAAREALTRAENDVARLQTQLQTLEDQYAGISQASDEERELEDLQARTQALKDKRAQAEESLAGLQGKLDAARDDANTSRDTFSKLQQDIGLKEREIKTLNDLLTRLSEGYENSLLLSLNIPADLARAVAAAAGDAALRAAKDDWSANGEVFRDREWPAGVTPLNTLIDAPAPLTVFVSSVGVVENDTAGAKLAQSLQRGQVLVTREGHIWRWDGLTATAEASDNESRILGIRAQIRDAQTALADLAPALATAKTESESVTARRDALAAEVSAAQAEAKAASSAVYDGEKRIAELQKTVNDRAMQRSLLEGQRKAAQDGLATAQSVRSDAASKQASLESTTAEDGLRINLESAESTLSSRRQTRDEISVEMEALKATAAQANQLRETLESEAYRTSEQIMRGESHAQTLTTRISELETRKSVLEPQIEADNAGTARQDIMDRIASAEEKVRNTSDAFTETDQRAKTLQADLKKVEEEGSALREKRAVIQATVAALQAEQTRIANEIEDRFASSPATLENTVITEWPEGMPSVTKAKAERESLLRERDAMGPVNLRAEVELNETETEHARMESEKIDLAAAIERLREGIGTLNTEARERIVKTFDAVNAHFQNLFKRLFAGGEAYLKFIDSDDPLEAGLEIFAQPPGKSLQSLSLLSGGEQTLTALAMIFSMFLSNPAPVCVLDEVDAPLDDANVDRVCGLLEEMAANCATRFLVITHHRMTMARMDRLYGVTMAERGVSQLVSVNLAAQGDFLERHKVA